MNATIGVQAPALRGPVLVLPGDERTSWRTAGAGLPEVAAHDLLALGGLRLLEAVSRHLQRGVAMYVHAGFLRPMGAYGSTSQGRSLGGATRDFSASVPPALAASLGRGEFLVGPSNALGLGNLLFLLIGRPRCPTGVLLPLGVEGRQGFIYADNGGRPAFAPDPGAFWGDVREAYRAFSREFDQVFGTNGARDAA